MPGERQGERSDGLYKLYEQVTYLILEAERSKGDSG